MNLNNPIELNRYGYTAGNPINATDPSGQNLVKYGAIVKFVTGAAAILRMIPKTVVIGTIEGLVAAWKALNYRDELVKFSDYRAYTIAVAYIEASLMR